MSITLHVDLVEQTPTALEMRFWLDNPNQVGTRTLALAEIDDLVEAAEPDYYSLLPAKMELVGQRLFSWLDGGERWLSREIQAAANRAQVLVLAIATPHRLGHLPWEVLHDGKSFLVHAPNPAVLPVRWRPAGTVAHTPANRPLQVLFMASSPQNVEPVLDYEQEESEILKATARWPLDLVVEESGSLEELGALLQDYAEEVFDVLHLTGHAAHAGDGTPVFVLEDSEGRRADATPVEFAREVIRRPPLVFLSGCRTGQASVHGEVRSFAEQLIDAGFRAVLGWGRPVLDTDATLAARHLYEHLASGTPLPLALVRTHSEMREKNVRDWHLLRLFCAGGPPAAFVTPLQTRGRRRYVARPAESEFLDPLTKSVKVATRASFVGRRRLLQRSLRRLRDLEGTRVGLLLHAQGGRGKSSIAARLCDRLRREFQRVVVIGRLDESRFTNAWADVLPNDGARAALRDHTRELRYRIQDLLIALAEAGLQAPLFVLDDFEQNQPDGGNGDIQIATHAAEVLLALFEALEHTGVGRVLITSRYALPTPFAAYLHDEGVPPLDETEQQKQALRLNQKAKQKSADSDLLAQAKLAADGNPRLFEWLHAVLAQPGLDHAAILARMQAEEERFREDILARSLIASLPEDDRVLLGRMLLISVPVPFAAVRVFDPDRNEPDLHRALGHAANLGLVDVTNENGEPHYRIPHQLSGGDPPLLPSLVEVDLAGLAEALFEVLSGCWLTQGKSISEARMLELIRLAANAGRKNELVRLATAVATSWLSAHRYAETAQLLTPLLDGADRHPMLLMNAGRALRSLGNGEESGVLLKEAVTRSSNGPGLVHAVSLFQYNEWLSNRGELDEVVKIGQEQLVPLLQRLGAERELAIALGQIADVLQRRGEFDEVLRIRREEELPVYERLGDARARAVALSQIADILHARGDLDEALRIRRDEQLPVFERLGDARARAVTLGQIADVLQARGEFDEALRIRREEQLPVYERLGDVKARAVTLGKIADVLQARGELDEALRIRREEQLPVYERLGDVRERAVALGKIADVLHDRGEFDEALRIRREDELPVYERLGDVRARAVTLGKIAHVLHARGEFDEALRIRREEELPVFERLGDVRELLVAQVNIAVLLLLRGHEEDFPEVIQLLRWSYQAAAQRGYKEAAEIAEIFQEIDLLLPDQAQSP